MTLAILIGVYLNLAVLLSLLLIGLLVPTEPDKPAEPSEEDCA